MASAGIAVHDSSAALSPFRFDTAALSAESIWIYLSVPGSSSIPMRVLDSDSVASVKLRIQSCRGFVVKKQKLVFDGRELARDDCLVRDYGVSDGNVLHLVIRLSDLRVISVKTACGKKFKFHIERSRSVGYVKRQIAKRGEDFVDPDEQRLIHDGEELDDEWLVQDICKYNDAVIHLLVRKSSAKVRTRTVEKNFELSIVTPDVTEKAGLDNLEVVVRNPLEEKVLVEPLVVNPKVELPLVIKNLIRSTLGGLEKGNPPIMSSEGTGGAYFMQDALGHEYVAVFKPVDEEPMAENNPRGLPLSSDGEGLKRGTRVGEGALREVAAYILDHPISGRRSIMGDGIGFSGVPPTAMARCLHEGFNHPNGFDKEEKNFKIGSLQMFVKNFGTCEDMGPRAFPVEEVHKIAVLDIRLANADRHAGNILFCKEGDEGRVVLVPIDHGYCLPENFEDCTFEWLYWPQARQPFNSETVEYIKSLDAEQDIALLKFYGWELSLRCCRTLRICTMLLKKGVERGLTPYDIGSILCRETLKKESKIEEIIREVEDNTLPGTSEAVFLESVAEIMDRRLNELTD
ncbi:phosphatidylinositol 4-kinase gamma 4-like [Iris pallida]|uniref:1-phosphatidylinositol 4-kinase n=1 Tax=Iris pallida TaxID=29817 RepID=A0AAX6G487_IRIPA|nr:phosphatidylinositol 4-kinase gamma 4-like [Iris pallida]KAJ6828521.1 phosphatidylinositol 4-kinase gamma 4-like [Iris pallida]